MQLLQELWEREGVLLYIFFGSILEKIHIHECSTVRDVLPSLGSVLALVKEGMKTAQKSIDLNISSFT